MSGRTGAVQRTKFSVYAVIIPGKTKVTSLWIPVSQRVAMFKTLRYQFFPGIAVVIGLQRLAPQNPI
jgi:hypothetical protein